jgi:hypothetical protein
VCDQSPSAPKSAAALRKALEDLWLSALSEQYKESSETWKALETKAQGAITVAGIFLAAVFAFAREAASLDLLPRILVMISAGLLVGSVAIALLSLEVRPLAPPPLGNFVDPGVQDLLKLADDKLSEATLSAFVSDRATEWRKSNSSLAEENRKKAKQVWLSQILLGTAAVPVAVVTIIVLL